MIAAKTLRNDMNRRDSFGSQPVAPTRFFL